MTEAVSLNPDLGRFGVWMGPRSITPELATEIESLGYGAAWIGGSPDADLAWGAPALAQSTSLQPDSGIVNRSVMEPPGSADHQTPPWLGWTEPWHRPRLCNWPPRSSIFGRHRRRRSPSPFSASKAPTREGFCSGSGWATPSTPTNTRSEERRVGKE